MEKVRLHAPDPDPHQTRPYAEPVASPIVLLVCYAVCCTDTGHDAARTTVVKGKKGSAAESAAGRAQKCPPTCRSEEGARGTQRFQN